MAKAAQDPMTKYSSGEFQQIDEKCEGCERTIQVESAKYCTAYTVPQAKWRLGICNFATHVKPEIATSTIKINPLKASKRAAAKGKKK
ncbi:PxxKW family cysteine-rich protein [Thiovibrio sp. JS02]